MIKDVFQCCYTNATKSKGASVVTGWDIVACSDGIPSVALEGCTRFQKVNSDLWRTWRGPTNREGDPVEGNNNPLNLLEIAGDGSYVYVIRTQYGLRDARGRRNMFSHAYILPWDKGLLHDNPHAILDILNRANFATSEEEALEEHDDFERDENMDIEAALKIAKIENDDELAKLIAVVYEQMTNANVLSPLYVQYDGSDEQLRALLQCIYSFLPLHLRRRLVSALPEGGNTAKYNVVFCTDASSHDLYFDSTMNTSSAIPSARLSAIRRLEFVDYAARNREELESEGGRGVQGYFIELEKIARSLNVTSSAPAQIARGYLLAHIMLVYSNVTLYEDDQLDRRIDEALRLASYNSDVLDDFLASMLNEVVKREMELTDANEQDLNNKLEGPHSRKLDDAAFEYGIYRIMRLDLQSAAGKLAQMPPDLFERHAKILNESSRGQEILDYYFANCLTDGSTLSWDKLEDVLHKSGYLRKNRERTLRAIKDAAWSLYCSKLSNLYDVIDAYNNYVGIVKQLVRKHEVGKYKRRAKREFWDYVDVNALDREQKDVYESMNINDCEKASDSMRLLSCYELLVPDKEGIFLREVYRILIEDKTKVDSHVRLDIETFIQMIKAEYTGTDQFLDKWVKLVATASDAHDNDMLEGVLDLRSAITENRRDDLVDSISSLRKAHGTADLRDSDHIFETIGSYVYECLCSMDNAEDPIPLDAWLTVGDMMFVHNRERNGSSFRIFDNDEKTPHKPFILGVDPKEVVAGSELIMQPKYELHANVYVKQVGAANIDVVKKWLKARESIRKSKDKNASGMSHTSDKDFRQPGLFALFARLRERLSHKK